MSRLTLVVCALCTLVAVALTSPAQADVLTKSIHDLSGKSHLDGAVDSLGIGMNPGFVIGTPGSGASGAFSASVSFYHASKFDLTGFPGLIGAKTVNSASLIIPDQGTMRSGPPHPNTKDFIVEHFASQNASEVVGADGTTAALSSHLAIPAGGTGNAGVNSTVTVDVTAEVIADLAAGRTLSSYRLGHDPAALAGLATPLAISCYQIDDSHGSGGGFDSGNQVRLMIDYTIPEPATATLLGLGALVMVRRKR